MNAEQVCKEHWDYETRQDMRVADLFEHDAVVEIPGHTNRGVAEIRQGYLDYFAAFPMLRVSPRPGIGNEREVGIEFTCYERDAYGVEYDSRGVTFVLLGASGKIASMRVYCERTARAAI